MMMEMAEKKEAAIRRQMMDHLVDAMGMADPSAYNVVATANTLKEVLAEKIEFHKRMIASLEWFSAHIGLDAPDRSLLVERVILEGLRSLYEKKSGTHAGWRSEGVNAIGFYPPPSLMPMPTGYDASEDPR